jgi:hypothetical protein
MTGLYYREERDRDLFEAFERIRTGAGRGLSVPAAAALAVLEPARSFYLTPLTIRRHLRRAVGKGLSRVMRETMRAELYARYGVYRLKRPGLTVSEAARMMETAPAPRFYLTAASAARIVYRMLGKR